MKKILQTKRLYLREFETGDIDAIAPILACEDVMRYSKTGVMTRREAEDKIAEWRQMYHDHGFAPWALIYQDKIIGYAGLDIRVVEDEEKVQVTYRLAKEYWGTGFATEIAAAVKEYAFNRLKLPDIIAIIDYANTASVNVAKKLGMYHATTIQHEGRNLHVYGAKNDGMVK